MSATTGGPASGFLTQLAEADQSALLSAGRLRRLTKGDALFVEGDPGDFVVVIVKGRTKVVAVTSDGTEVVLSLRGPGDLVGELATIDDEPKPRMAALIAIEPVECRVVSTREFREFLEHHPQASIELLRMVAAKLRDAERRRVEFGAVDATRRLARLLVELSDEAGLVTAEGTRIAIALSQQELAGLVGASRESIARALITLRQQGLVTTSRRVVVVRDPAGLRTYGS
jgi:CRP-like cAMP-binding protein